MDGIIEVARFLNGTDYIMPILIPIVAILLVWFVRASTTKFWLK